jgi:hypothetical protein
MPAEPAPEGQQQGTGSGCVTSPSASRPECSVCRRILRTGGAQEGFKMYVCVVLLLLSAEWRCNGCCGWWPLRVLERDM